MMEKREVQAFTDVKQPYSTPILEKQEIMRIAEETIEQATGKLVCKQCSSCHGCR